MIQRKACRKRAELCYDIIALSQKLLRYLSTPLKIEVIFFRTLVSAKDPLLIKNYLHYLGFFGN